MKKPLGRLLAFFSARRLDCDFDQELETHLVMLTEDYVRAGMTPEEARHAALLRLGGRTQLREAHREIRGMPLVSDLIQDVQYAFRAMRKRSSFAAIAILTLALGIGANSAIFSVVNFVMLRPLPYRDPSRLVRIIENVPANESFTGRPFRRQSMDPEEALELRRQSSTLSYVAPYLPGTMVLSGGHEATVVKVAVVDPSLFSMLGVQPFMGSFLGTGEAPSSIGRAVILSYTAWRKYFAADRNILGRTAILDDTSYLIVGVMPAGFEFPDSNTSFWTRLDFAAAPDQRALFAVMARLNSGVSLSSAAQEVNAIFRRLRGESGAPASRVGRPRMEVVPVQEAQAASYRPALFVLLVAVGFVLLIACANVANLLLARTSSRQREFAIRASLGAGTTRLVRQCLTESAILALVGGSLGIFLAYGGVHLLEQEWPGNINPVVFGLKLEHIPIDAAVVSFTLAVSILTGLLFGLAPALRVCRTEYLPTVQGSVVPQLSGMGRKRGARAGLVIAESAMAMLLLVGAGLLIRSFIKLSTVDPGFDSRHVLTFQVASPPTSQRDAFNQELVARLESMPNAAAAGFGEVLPLENGLTLRPLRIPGLPQEGPFSPGQPRTLEGSWDYLRAVGIRLSAGRLFRESDGTGGPQVMLVNRALARRYFGGANPIGKIVYSLGKAPWEIVGVVDDVRQRGPQSEPQPQFFLEYRQMLHALSETGASTARMNANQIYFAVRTRGDPSHVITNIRALITQLDANAALTNVARLEDVVSDSIAAPRFYATILGIFAGAAVALAVIGIYGIISYLVTQRTREIAIRMALGAKRKEVLGLILRQSAVLTTAGVLLGFGGAVALTRYVRSMLFGLSPLDPETFAASAVMFGMISLVVSYLPARRAAKVDPAVALRYE